MIVHAKRQSSETEPGPTVADLLRRYGPAYLAQHVNEVTPHQAKVLHELIRCRTPEAGGHAWKCPGCDHVHVRYHSCGDRHCPTCGGQGQSEWLDRMLTWKLPVKYLHIVFTIPHELIGLIQANQKILHTLLFQSAWKGLSNRVSRRLCIKLCAVMVLHTWGQRMNAHVHIHTIVPIGGLSIDELRWIHGTDPDVFFETDGLAERFRKFFIKGLLRLHRKGELRLTGDLAHLADPKKFEAWLAPIQAKRWNIKCQTAPDYCQGPDAALKYLAHYVRGTAISNSRILCDDGKHVTIAVKDYRHGGRRIPIKMTGQEFIRRFLLHILPRYSHRVRYFGFLAHPCRKENLTRCREIFNIPEDDKTADDSADESNQQGDGYESALPAPTCPKCGTPNMVWQYEIQATTGWQVTRSLTPPSMRSRFGYHRVARPPPQNERVPA